MKHWLVGILAGAVLAVATVPSLAQETSTNRVGAQTDWSVFVEDNPTQCWVVSMPRETVNTRDGRVVSVNRGEILMFVSFWPGQERLGEVSFTGGYLFADGANGGVKSFVMPHPDKPDKEIWYASLEGPEAAAYERGVATLSKGEAWVPFSESFGIVANPETMTVILTSHSADTYGLAVVEKI